MSTPSRAPQRQVRRGGLVASLLTVAALLSGCGGADSESVDFEGDAAYGPAAESRNDADFAGAEAPGSAQWSTADRSVIITGAMYMTVDDPIAVADRAATIVQNAGGRIDARNETAPDERYGGSASLTLRIPSNRLDAVVDGLRGLGTVDRFTTNSFDVTTEVEDLAAEISTLRASTARIEALLSQAEDISDIITLENELDRRQARLESLEARQRGLEDQVSMSTIDLSLTTEPVVIVDDSPEDFWDALKAGWDSFVGFLSGALIVLGVMLPWLVVISVIVLVWIVRTRARKSRIAPTKPSTAPAKTRTASAKSAATRK